MRLLFAAAVVGAVTLSAPLAVAQVGSGQVICDEIDQRYRTNESHLNTRTLNFLFFDASERGCLELVRKFLGLGASVGARDRFGEHSALDRRPHGRTQSCRTASC